MFLQTHQTNRVPRLDVQSWPMPAQNLGAGVLASGSRRNEDHALAHKGKPRAPESAVRMRTGYASPSATYWDREFSDSPLEQAGFELPVPPALVSL
jgi:hypothetical protein